MSKRVFLCEKPDQARIVAEALGGGRRVEGAWEGPGWMVCWAFGHLLEPVPPESYNPAWKTWDFATLPIVPEVFRFDPRDSRAAQQIKIIGRIIKDAAEVVVATDADREGEMIGREILDRVGWKGTVFRLWLSDLTLPAVKKALAKLRPGHETLPLYHAALARTQADWLVGMNMSRAVTLRFRQGPGKPLSVGRVQTPTLALIVRLERRILAFRPEDYFEIPAEVESEGYRFQMRYAPSVARRIRDLSQAERLARSLIGKMGKIKVVQEEKELSPPPLFDLNSLQQEANGRFGWSADKTLRVAQKLYEERQILTYPRTDCQVLPEEHKFHLKDLISMLLSMPELAYLGSRLERPLVRTSVYNDQKVTAHHAIVPTLKKPDLKSLEPDERLLWELVARQFLAVHLPDYRFQATGIDLDIESTVLKARGNVPVFMGWKEAFQGVPEADPKEDRDPSQDTGEENEENKGLLPPVRDGAIAHVISASVEKKTTKPPQRFTEKTLLRAMKNISSYVEEETARRRLRQTSGIGTPATRAGIIETLKARGYVEMRKRQIVPTDMAMALVEALEKVVPSYCDPALTAVWEDVLEDVAAGRRPMEQFIQATVDRIRRDVSAVKTASGVVQQQLSPSSSKKIDGVLSGTPLMVRFEDKDKAKALGARWDVKNKRWMAPEGADLEIFRRAGFLGDG